MIDTDKKILLLIEDNPLLTGLYKSAFEKAGLEVVVVHDGKDGLEMAKLKKPNLILLDFLMIGINGFEVLTQLKSDPETKDIKVIMLTVASEQENKDKAKELGVSDYLVKPDLTIDQIVQAVTSHL